jgi:hypothetical protein
MSEPIKNTLFRFVTLRSPELIKEKQKQDYHIHHPNPTSEGFFKTQLSSPAATPVAQAAQLKTKALTFSPFADTTAAKNFVGQNFFDFSVWLAKNRYAVFHQEAVNTPQPIPNVLTDTQLLTVWDNLFYQLITGKNPQVRQSCIELLVADGYLSSAGQSYQHQLAEARVIIPAVFYGSNNDNSLARVGAPSSSTDEPEVFTADLKKISKSVLAQQKVTDLQQLQEELHTAQKKYERQNKAAYEVARVQYENDLREIMQSYYNSHAGEPENNGFPSPGPNIPQFEFAPLPEMTSALLEESLSPRSATLAQQLNLPDNGSFIDAFEKINDAIASEMPEARANAQNGTRTLVLNNMLLPVQDRTLPENEQYSFYMQPVHRQGSFYSILATINMGYPNAHATATQYNAVLNNGVRTDTVFNEVTDPGNSLMLELYPVNHLAVPQGQTNFRFHGHIILSGGIKLLFDTTLNILQGGWGIMTAEKVTGTDDEEFEITAPSGYGIKRLGVADYRKVEQSVCCYLPGEVSHIENVMAREYKERSSRRLSRAEDTTVFERSMEKEIQNDTSTTERYELQKEINSVISKDMSADAHASVSGTTGQTNYDAGANFAFNTSKEDSNRNAVNYSKEVTEKALERVVQKIREERTIKIVEEFEEQQKHGFDNRLGENHVSGVYRWVDKVYKNQVFNYGKRLMYEFMIPQPATFHNEAVKILAQTSDNPVLEKPVDPRAAAGIFRVTNPSQLNSFTFPYWAGITKRRPMNLCP